MNIRLVASDLDGTLFGADHLPAPRTVAAINALVDAGVIFVAVTGRSHFGGVERVTSTGARPQWFIGSNGGHRVNLGTGALEERLVFESRQLRDVLSHLPTVIDGIGFGFEHEAGFTWDDAFMAVHPEAYEGGPRVNTAPLVFHDVGKFFVAHRDASAEELFEAMTPHLPSDRFHLTTSGIAYLEVTPAGADKGAALARLCEVLGVAASEVIAFGDNHNDVTMLEWAGRSVAMANAVPAAIAAADEVTASNVDFGVAAVLETLLG